MFNFDFNKAVSFDKGSKDFTVATCGIVSKDYNFLSATTKLIRMANNAGSNDFTMGHAVDMYFTHSIEDLTGIMNLNELFGFVSAREGGYTVTELAYEYYNASLDNDTQLLYNICMRMHIKAATNTKFAAWYILWNDCLAKNLGREVVLTDVEQSIKNNTTGFNKTQIRVAAADVWRLLKQLYISDRGPDDTFSRLELASIKNYRVSFNGAPITPLDACAAVKTGLDEVRSIVAGDNDCVALDRGIYDHVGLLMGFPHDDFSKMLSKMHNRSMIRYETQLDLDQIRF